MATEKVIKIKVESKQADKKVKDLGKQTDKTSDSVGGLGGKIDAMTGGAISKFKGMLAGIKGVNSGFKLMRLAIIATGIGLLLLAVLALKTAFSASEEGQNKWAKIMQVIGSITGNLIDLLADLGEKIIWVFENPKKAIKAFVKLLRDQIINRFKGLLELIPKLGKAIGLLFQGKFKEAGKVAADATGKVVLGIESITDATQRAINKTQKFIEELKREAKIAGEIADKRADADKLDRDLIVERAEADRKIIALREIASRRDLHSLAERKKALEDASSISDAITKKEIASAKLRFDAIVAENKLARSSKDDLEKEAQAKAKLIQLETQRINLQRRLGLELSAISGQEAAEAKSRAAAKQTLIDEEKKADQIIIDAVKKTEKERADAIEKIREDFRIKQQDLEDETELQKIERRRERSLAELEDLKASEEEKAEIRLFFTNLIKDEETKIESDALDQQIKDAKEARKQRLKEEELLAEGKRELAETVTNVIFMLAKKGGKLAKGVAVSQALMNTYQSITSVLAAPTVIPEPFGTVAKIANAALVSGIGFANVKNILATDESGSSGAGAGGGDTPSAPSFNLVQGTGTNQIAEGILSQDQPIKAFVVSSDVSTGQEADRKIVKGASL